MTTETDLRDAYAHLSELAPTRAVLELPRPGGDRRRGRSGRVRGRLRLVLVAATVLLLALASPVLVHWLKQDDRSTPQTPATATFPTAYFFGPSSIAGYRLDIEGLSADGQAFVFTNPKTRTGASLTVEPVTAANNSLYGSGDPVTIGGHTGFFVGVWGGSTKTLTVAWKLNTKNWATLSANRAGSEKSVTRPQLLAVVASVHAAHDDHAALVVVGHLPAHMRFDGVNVYQNQGMMASPDLYTGTGYRDESFVDRRSESGGRFDIVSVYHPFQSLATATPKTLPTFDDGPWTRTTVRGHLAWTAPHDVLIQWGSIIIDLVSNRPTGNTSIALVSRKDLLAVARSLTVPASNAVGHGFPLGTSLPRGAFE